MKNNERPNSDTPITYGALYTMIRKALVPSVVGGGPLWNLACVILDEAYTDDRWRTEDARPSPSVACSAHTEKGDEFSRDAEELRKELAQVSEALRKERAARAHGRGTVSYVSSDGAVTIPIFILEHLGLTSGGTFRGGVVFRRQANGHVEMLTDEQLIDEVANAEEHDVPDETPAALRQRLSEALCAVDVERDARAAKLVAIREAWEKFKNVERTPRAEWDAAYDAMEAALGVSR